MNLVSLLIATSVVKYSDNIGLRVGIAVGAVIVIVAAVVISKRRSAGMGEVVPSEAEAAGAVSPAVEALDVTHAPGHAGAGSAPADAGPDPATPSTQQRE
jgi:K(+)-stimulated pyrophosphate-energized sodium pump